MRAAIFATVLMLLLLLLLLQAATPSASVSPASPQLQLTSFNGSAVRQVLELLVVADTSFINKAGGEAQAAARVTEIVKIANSLWRSMQLSVVLTHLLLWREDAFPITDSIEDTMLRFSVYKSQNVTQKHDLGILLTGKGWNSNRTMGHQWTGGLCHRITSAGCAADMHQSAAAAGWVAARVIAHSIGINNLAANPSCTCDAAFGCVLGDFSGTHPSIEQLGWSSCSVAAWRSMPASNTWLCLQDVPQSQHSSGSSSCGNGIVEPGEMCDCGTVLTCNSNCCNASSCQLAAGAACHSGSCCNRANCQLLARGSVCRSAHGDCDVPETCDGVSEWCPADDKKADGVECEANQAYCYKGSCGSRDAQCRRTASPSATSAHEMCYNLLNGRGDLLGHCSSQLLSAALVNGTTITRNLSYAPCASADNRCGLLHCQQATRPENANSITVSGHTCYSFANIDYSSSSIRSPSLSPDGAACGSEAMCVNSSCQPVPAVASCSGNGVATSSNTCFCSAGYTPPSCEQSGCGGSVTSPLACIAEPTGSVLLPVLLGAVAAVAIVVAAAVVLLLLLRRRRQQPTKQEQLSTNLSVSLDTGATKSTTDIINLQQQQQQQQSQRQQDEDVYEHCYSEIDYSKEDDGYMSAEGYAHMQQSQMDSYVQPLPADC